MDRTIEKKRWTQGRLITVICICSLIIFLTYLMISRSGKTRLKVDPNKITRFEVKYDEFVEYYPFDGTVEPVTSVYLDIEQGGRVEEVFVEGGHPIKKGDLILRLSNSTLRRSSIDTETRLLENLDALRNTQLQLAQNKITLEQELLILNYDIMKLEKQYKRYKVLKNEDIVISDEQFETVEDQLNLCIDRRKLLKKRIKQENILSEKQLEQANKSIERLNISLDLLAKTVESLEVRAPISGYLSNISADIGQSIVTGQRIGQVDVLDSFKIRAFIDQYYMSKVSVGTKGNFSLDGKTYDVEVKKTYSEVLNDQFMSDLAFMGELPEGIKRGQTLTIKLSFSEAEEKLVVKTGGFYQETSGRWVYLISKDGKTAYRQSIRLGRQNPSYVEVLEGLQEGDWVITSGYDTYNKADILIFEEQIILTR